MPVESAPYRVALIGDRMRPNTFQFMRGVLQYMHAAGNWQVVGNRVEPLQTPDHLDLTQVDGVLGMFTDQRWIDQAVAAGVNAVNMSVSLSDERLPRVSIDDHAVGRMGARYLMERGFSHLGFVSMDDPGWYVARRREGFVTAIEQQGNRHCHIPDDDAQEPCEDRDAFRAWVDKLPKPIGIMACNDAVACRAIEVILSLGLRIPHDVAVLGVDNDLFTAELMTPHLSSVEPDNRAAGYHAAELLNRLMQGGTTRDNQWLPPICVVTRESTDIVMSRDPLVTRALRYIEDHCSQGISVEDVLEAMGVSRRSLERHMKAATGRTPRNEIRRAQIDQARKILLETKAPMYEIAQACGFDHQSRFFIVFKRETGMTPADFRRRRAR